MAELLRAIFGPSGAGFVIVKICAIAVVGWLAGLIASAAGRGDLTNMIRVASVFLCIVQVAAEAWKAVTAFGHFIGY